ncbi:hypothetical protein AJ87_05790 [Rhizobium yanglingense]|nr:hypothetical protein AJ87_05790 [Rhizobium yanglingense]
MPFKRKLSRDRETLAAHLKAGLTIDGIAEVYGCGKEAARRELVRHGLIEARSRAVLLAEAFEREIAPEPTKRDILLSPTAPPSCASFSWPAKASSCVRSLCRGIACTSRPSRRNIRRSDHRK